MGKKLPSLALSLTDLIVRQKQVTVGLPGKEIIISRPLGAHELKDKIYSAHDGDVSTSSLSQEYDQFLVDKLHYNYKCLSVNILAVPLSGQPQKS